MNENNNNAMMPELTLNAEASQVEAPQLVLGTEPAAPAVEEKKAEPVKIDPCGTGLCLIQRIQSCTINILQNS